jgi:multiple sugar transport system permease protein
MQRSSKSLMTRGRPENASFLWPLIVTDSDKSRTLPVGIVLFALPRWQQFNLVVAASVSVLLPMLIFYLIFQRQFVEGIVLTGLKY